MTHPNQVEPDAIHLVEVPFQGISQSKQRPAIIDRVNYDRTVSVFPIYKKYRPNRILLRASFETGLQLDSYIDVARRVTVARRAVGKRIGNLPFDPALYEQLPAS